MRRREFVASLGGAVFLALPVRAQTARFSRVGFLSAGNFELSTNPGRLTEEIVRLLAQSGSITGTAQTKRKPPSTAQISFCAS